MLEKKEFEESLPLKKTIDFNLNFFNDFHLPDKSLLSSQTVKFADPLDELPSFTKDLLERSKSFALQNRMRGDASSPFLMETLAKAKELDYFTKAVLHIKPLALVCIEQKMNIDLAKGRFEQAKQILEKLPKFDTNSIVTHLGNGKIEETILEKEENISSFFSHNITDKNQVEIILANLADLRLDADSRKQVFSYLSYFISRNVSLEDFILAQGGVKDKEAHSQKFPAYKLENNREAETYVLTNGNTFFCHRTGEKGNMYDFVMKNNRFEIQKGIRPTEFFVNKILSQELLSHIPNKQYKVDFTQKSFTPSDASLRYSRNVPAENYFTKERGIKATLFTDKLFKDTIFWGNFKDATKPELDKFDNLLFVYKTRPFLAGEMFSRLDRWHDCKTIQMQFNDGNRKLFAKGASKGDCLWFSNYPEQPLRKIVVVENPLDALSHAQMGRDKSVLYCATGGEPSDMQFRMIANLWEQEIRDKKRPINLEPAFDNDFSGARFEMKLLEKIMERGYNKFQFLEANKDDFKFRLDADQKIVKEIVDPLERMYFAEKAQGSENRNHRFEVVVKQGYVEITCGTNKQIAHFVVDKMALLMNNGLKFTRATTKDFNQDLTQGVRTNASNYIEGVSF